MVSDDEFELWTTGVVEAMVVAALMALNGTPR